MKEAIIRFKESIRIYKDSSTCQATYADLVRVYEDMIEMLEMVGQYNRVGFNNCEKQGE